MKSYKISFRLKIAGLALTALLLASCEDFLTVESKSQYDSENLFQTVTHAEMAAYGAYVVMTNPMYGRKVVTFCTTDSDEMRHQGGWEAVGRRNLTRYSSTPSSIDTELNGLWDRWYRCIERANICIDRIPKMDLYEDGTDEEKIELKRILGEMLALRAMCYFDLVKLWGDVPFTTEPSQAGDDHYLERTDRDVIYDHIIDDLLKAVDLVPWRKEIAAVQARWTKGAIKGMTARIALHAAGYSLRWDLGSGGNMGMRTRSDGARIEELYRIAREQCREIINDADANHRLNPNYQSIWYRVCNSEFDTDFGESMFEVGMYNPVVDASDANGSIGNKIGAPCNKESTYGKGSTETRMIPAYVHAFDSRDVRKDVTICDWEVKADDTGVVTNNGWEYSPGKWRAWWFNRGQGYMPEFTNINWIMIRYSDILLMFAEADNRLSGGPTADAVDALKQVRKRAFAGNESIVEAENYLGMSEEQFLEVIMNERWLEFGAEALRKYDLLRWNKLGERLAYVKENNKKLASLKPGDADYDKYTQYVYYKVSYNVLESRPVIAYSNDSSDPRYTKADGWVIRNYMKGIGDNNDIMSAYARDFTDNMTELYPIPQSIRDANPRLSQHPSY